MAAETAVVAPPAAADAPEVWPTSTLSSADADAAPNDARATRTRMAPARDGRGLALVERAERLAQRFDRSRFVEFTKDEYFDRSLLEQRLPCRAAQHRDGDLLWAAHRRLCGCAKQPGHTLNTRGRRMQRAASVARCVNAGRAAGGGARF